MRERPVLNKDGKIAHPLLHIIHPFRSPMLVIGMVVFFMTLVPVHAAKAKVDLTEMSLEELMDVRIKPVTSASKYEQKAFEAPSSVTVVTSEEIAKFGYRTIGELLQSVRGFYITNDRNYSYVGFRGMNRPGDYSSRILLLVDGIRINDNIYDSAAVGMDFVLDVDLIKRVEIVRGPSYALYGNNAFFVVVNVISKESEDIGSMEASMDAGSYDTYKGRMSSGRQFENGSQLMVSGSLFGSQGQSHYYPEFDTPDQNNGIASGCDEEEAGSLFLKYAVKDVVFTGAYVKRNKEIPTAPWEVVFNDDRNESWDERAFADVKIIRNLNTKLDLSARLTYGYYTYEGEYAYFDEDLEESYISRDQQRGEWWGADFHFIRKADSHTWLAGGEYRDNYRLKQKNYDELGYVYLNDDHDTQNWALFVQDEYKISSMFKVNASIRYDHFSTFGGDVNPRIALIFQPVQTTSIKYLAGSAFRAPNAYELYYNDGGISQKANPDLKDESITSHELVWEQMFGQYYLNSASVYYFKIEDLITQATDVDDLLVFLNQDRVEARGIENEISAAYPNDVKATLSYAFQKSEYNPKDAIWTNSPRHLGKFGLSFPLIRKKWFMGIEEQYTGKLKTLSGAFAGNYFITNLTLLGKEVLKNMDISASVYNIFDRRYAVPGSAEHVQDAINQDGVNFRVKITCGF